MSLIFILGVYSARFLKSNQNAEVQLRRDLVSDFSVSKSVISGNGIINILNFLGTTRFETNATVTIIVTPKNSNGDNLKVGEDIVYVSITNACTKGVNYPCNLDSDAITLLDSNIRAQMKYSSDGTYTYDYKVPKPGTITISVLLYTQGGVYVDYF